MVAGMKQTHPLKAWLREHKTRQYVFAIEAGISPQMLSDMIQGRRRPSLGVAVRISDMTSGAVPADLWLRDRDA
jgi:hypothetical protein